MSRSARERRGDVVENPMELVDTPPTGEADTETLTANEVLHVRQAFLRGEMSTPKSKAGRRVVHLGGHAVAAREEQFQASNYTTGESIVFCHEALGTPLDPSRLTTFARRA